MWSLLTFCLGVANAGVVDGIEASVGDQSVALPFGNVAPRGAVRPAVTVGVEHLWVDRARWDVLTPVGLGFHAHPTIGNGLRLGTGGAVRWTPGVPMLEGGLDVGTHYLFRPRPVLGFDEETGTYAEEADPGRPTFVFGFHGAVGVQIEPVTVFLGYRWFGQTAFLPAVGLGPQSTLYIGARWAFGGAS